MTLPTAIERLALTPDALTKQTLDQARQKLASDYTASKTAADSDATAKADAEREAKIVALVNAMPDCIRDAVSQGLPNASLRIGNGPDWPPGALDIANEVIRRMPTGTDYTFTTAIETAYRSRPDDASGTVYIQEKFHTIKIEWPL